MALRDPFDPQPEPRPDLDRRAAGHPYSWHPWFAWRPVRLPDGRRAFLRWIARKAVREVNFVELEFGVTVQESRFVWRYDVAERAPRRVRVYPVWYRA